MAGFVALTFVAAFVALALFWRSRDSRRLREAFEAAGALEAHAAGGRTVEGVIDGRFMRCAVVPRKHAIDLVVTTTSPPGLPDLEIHLRPQAAADARLVERGREIDVETGDPIFDPKVVVEAAPTALALALLDDEVRERVLAAMPCKVDASVANVIVTATRRGARDLPVDITVGAARALSRRLAAIVAERANARVLVPADDAGGGYREPAAKTVDAPDDPAAAAELARVRGVRKARARRQGALALAVLMLYVGAVAFVVGRGRRPASSKRAGAAAAAAASARPLRVLAFEPVTHAESKDSEAGASPSPDGSRVLLSITDKRAQTTRVVSREIGKNDVLIANDAFAPHFLGDAAIVYTSPAPGGPRDVERRMLRVASKPPFGQPSAIADGTIVAASDDGKRIAYVDGDTLVVSDPARPGASEDLQLHSVRGPAAFSSDRKSLAYVDISGRVAVRDLSNGKTTTLGATAGGVALSPDGQLVAHCAPLSGSQAALLEIVRVANGAAYRPSDEHCVDVAWARDGWIYVGNDGRILRMRLDIGAIR